MRRIPGAEAVERKGWWRAHRYLLLRRLSQLTVMGLFLIGPWFGLWLFEGNLSSSRVMDTIPLTDPFVLLQLLAAGHWPLLTAWLGALMVLAGYALVGGRVFCSWVCPLNPVTDAAAWLRRRLGLRQGSGLSNRLRYWLLATILVVPLIGGVVVWESVNPVSLLHRGLLFGMGWGWLFIVAVFLFDTFVVDRGWCGHLCPQGAFWGLVNRLRPIQVTAAHRQQCTSCMDCYAVCPEPQVLKGPVHGARRGVGPEIEMTDCSHCGRCIDVCSEDVFSFTTRFAKKAENKT